MFFYLFLQEGTGYTLKTSHNYYLLLYVITVYVNVIAFTKIICTLNICHNHCNIKCCRSLRMKGLHELVDFSDL